MKKVTESMLRHSGMPFMYREKKKMPEPVPYRYKRGSGMKKVSVETQQKLIKDAMKEPLNYPYLLGLFSYPTPVRAMRAASRLVIKQIEMNVRINVICIDPFYWERKWWNQTNLVEEKKRDLVVIHNVTENDTPDRFQLVRDMVMFYSDAFVIVAVVTRNAVELFRDKLNIGLDSGINFSKTGRTI
jgi:hypothetical protein